MTLNIILKYVVIIVNSPILSSPFSTFNPPNKKIKAFAIVAKTLSNPDTRYDILDNETTSLNIVSNTSKTRFLFSSKDASIFIFFTFMSCPVNFAKNIFCEFFISKL